MPMYSEPTFDVPELTAEVAQAAFPKGNRYMKVRDALGSIYTDDQFAHLYPQVGQPAASPWRLGSSALVESTVNEVISKRMVKNQQMRWTKRGAHLLLPVRVRTLNRDLKATFGRRYPGMAATRAEELPLAV